MDDKQPIAVVAVLILTLLNFFFTLAEASLVTMGRLRIGARSRPDLDEPLITGTSEDQRAVSHRSPAENAITDLLAEPTRVVAAVQVAITLVSLASLAVTIVAFAPGLTQIFEGRFNHPVSVRLAFVVLVLAIAFINLVIGEIVPRAIAARYPEQVAGIIASPLKLLEWFERPVVAVLLGVSNLLVKPFGMTASFATPLMTEDELKVILEAGQTEGVIEEDEKEMLHNVISFGDTQAHQVMTPRVDVCAIEMDQPIEKLIYLIVDHGHSRIPVYKDTIDTIVGIVHAKDLLPGALQGEHITSFKGIMREPTYVPEHLPIDDLLTQMRRSNTQLAIVQDEYGGTAGLVTIEDLIEEIVGEIQDEYDPEQTLVETDLRTGTSLVDARMPIDDVNQELNLSLPSVDFDTIGGLVFGLVGRPPEVGDKVETTVGADGELTVRFHVVKADGRRLQQVSIESFPTPRETEADPKDSKKAVETA